VLFLIRAGMCCPQLEDDEHGRHLVGGGCWAEDSFVVRIKVRQDANRDPAGGMWAKGSGRHVRSEMHPSEKGGLAEMCGAEPSGVWSGVWVKMAGAMYETHKMGERACGDVPR
jgi:hypothetical protein